MLTTGANANLGAVVPQTKPPFSSPLDPTLPSLVSACLRTHPQPRHLGHSIATQDQHVTINHYSPVIEKAPASVSHARIPLHTVRGTHVLDSPLDIRPSSSGCFSHPSVMLAGPTCPSRLSLAFDVTSWCGMSFSGFCAHMTVPRPALRLPRGAVCFLGPNTSPTGGETEASDC